MAGTRAAPFRHCSDARRLLARARFDGRLDDSILADHAQEKLSRNGECGEHAVQVVDARDDPPIDGHEEIAGPQPRRLGRAAGGDLDDFDGVVAQQIVLAHDPPGKLRRRGDDPQRKATDPAMADQFGHDPFAVAAGTANPSPWAMAMMAVFTPTTWPRVQQRTAGVAWVQRRGVLNNILDEPSPFAAHRPPKRADDARGNRRLETKRIAHGDHQLSHLQAVRVAQFGRRQIAGGEAEQGQVRGRIIADQIGVQGVAFRRHGAESSAAVHDVAVRNCIPIRREEETGADASARIVRRPRHGDDCRPNFSDHRDDRPGIGVQQVGVGRRGGDGCVAGAQRGRLGDLELR